MYLFKWKIKKGCVDLLGGGRERGRRTIEQRDGRLDLRSTGRVLLPRSTKNGAFTGLTQPTSSDHSYSNSFDDLSFFVVTETKG